MNSLNSILIEGSVKDQPKSIPFDMVDYSFTLEVVNCVNENTFKFINVLIKTSGRLAQTCIQTLNVGRSIRVVGYMDSGENGNLFIYAQHIEFKNTKE
jgi:primosomal replication protein N